MTTSAPLPRAPRLALLVALWMLAWAGMKLSLPALPELERVFDVSGGALRVTVSAFFTCFALGQLAWGVISDHIGRRPPLLLGLGLACIGSVVVLLSESVVVFGIGRCLQGLGLSAVGPVGRAILFESRSLERAKQELGRVSMCTAAIPMFAQVVGGYLVAFASWRWIFAVFLAASMLLLLLVWQRLPETQPQERDASKLAIGHTLLHILRHRDFWSHALCYMVCSGTLLGYYAAMPFWYSKHLSIPVQIYPWLAGFTVGSYVLALSASRRLMQRYNSASILWIGLALALLPGIGLMCLWSTELSRLTTITTLVGASMILALGAGCVFPVANAGAIKPFPECRGLVSAVTLTGVCLIAGIMAFMAGRALPSEPGYIGLTLAAPLLLTIPVVFTLRRSVSRAPARAD